MSAVNELAINAGAPPAGGGGGGGTAGSAAINAFAINGAPTVVENFDLSPASLGHAHGLAAVVGAPAGTTFGEAIFNYRPLSEVLDHLATLVNKWWRIDHHGVFHFRARGSEPAPWTLTGIDCVGDPAYSRATPMYRNRQYIRGLKDVTDPQTFGPRAGDGQSREWTMGFPIARVPTVHVNGVERTVDLKMFADSHSADFYWQKGDPVIVQDANAAVLGSGDSILVVYQGEFNIIIRSDDTAEQARLQVVEGGGSGIVEAVDDDSSITDRASGLTKASALLAKYGVEGETLRFKTYRSGLVPGMVLIVDLPAHNLNGDQMLITSVRTVRTRTASGFAYCRHVTAIIGANVGSWARFFSRLVRPPAFVDQVSLGEETSLTIVQAFDDAVSTEDEMVVTPTACPFPATDLYPATSLYPC